MTSQLLISTNVLVSVGTAAAGLSGSQMPKTSM